MMELKNVPDAAWYSGAIVLGFLIFIAFFKAQIAELISSISKRGFKFSNFSVNGEEATAAAQQDKEDAGTRQELVDISSFHIPKIVEHKAQEFRNEIDKCDFRDSKDREKWLLREAAELFFSREFERTYIWIYGSQMQLLKALNEAAGIGISVNTLRTHFNDLRNNSGDFYRTDTAERWYGHLISFSLAIENQDRLFITDVGKEFIQYVVQRGYSLEGLYQWRKV